MAVTAVALVSPIARYDGEAPALRAERDGRTFYFCGEHRQKTFLSTLVQSMAERGRSGDGL